MQLGPYEIESQLGVGGMGEVYRARDTRLDRTVAVKILPEHLGANEAARQRFDREARSVSALSHPNICQLFDVGHQDGIDFIVMEYLEGETLAERIKRGPIPTDQLLKIGTEICEGLERAHKSGVIHRDIKPANVMLTKSGAKLMDFGLAKPLDAPEAPTNLTQSIALPGSATTKAPGSGAPPGSGSTGPLTQAGVVVGTYQYMSPEQVEGKPADVRSDIFTFGCVLYEMATAKRAFDGKTSHSVVAAILERDPAPISSLEPASPLALDRLVKSCLAKDPDDRWQTAHDVRLQLQALRDGSQASYSNADAIGVMTTQRERTQNNRNTALLMLATLVGSGIVFSVLGYMVHAPKPIAVIRAAMALPDGVHINNLNPALALSPDGSTFAFAAAAPSEPQMIWVRSLDADLPHALPGTESGDSPFWSPDGKSLGFFTGDKLKRIDIATGNVSTLADAPAARGGSWGSQNTILFAPTNNAGLSMVSASGGQVTQVTPTQTGVTDRLPWFMPDGVRALFLRSKSEALSANEIMVVDTRSKEVQDIGATSSNVQYVEPGYLLYTKDATLFAAPFNARTLRMTGAAFPVVREVTSDVFRRSAQFAAANNGTLIYLRDAGYPVRQLAWYNLATGEEMQKIGEPARYLTYTLSPDETRVATWAVKGASTQPDADSEIWVQDLERNTSSRLTFGNGSFQYPVWTADGASIVYVQLGAGSRCRIFRKNANGEGDATQIPYQGDVLEANAVTPDNKLLAGSTQLVRFFTILLVSLDGSQPTKKLIEEEADARDLQFSADGKFVSYITNEEGHVQLYAASYPAGGGRWQISKSDVIVGGWTQVPGQLNYMGTDGTLYVVQTVENGGAIEVSSVEPAFGGKPLAALKNLPIGAWSSASNVTGVTRDGKKILLAVPVNSDIPEAVDVISDWRSAARKQ
jgi:serine/threonine protein kinase